MTDVTSSLYSMNSPPESGWRGGSHTTGTQYDEPPEPYTDAGIVNLPYSPPDSPGPNGSEHSGCNYRDSGDSDLLGALSSRCSRPRSALFLSSDSDNASNPQELSIPSPFASPRSDYSAKGGLSEPYQSIHNVLDQTELERQRQGGTSVLSQSSVLSGSIPHTDSSADACTGRSGRLDLRVLHPNRSASTARRQHSGPRRPVWSQRIHLRSSSVESPITHHTPERSVVTAPRRNLPQPKVLAMYRMHV